MGTTTTFKNILLNANDINKVRLHTGATTDGTQNTISKTTTGLAEADVTYGVAANGEIDITAPVDIENMPVIADPAKVTHFSYWAGTVYRGSKAFTKPESYENVDSTARISSLKITLADLA